MAPRGRQTKARLARIDAAVDAMKPYGFSEGAVKAKMKELVEAYEGEYLFIEQDSYKVLLEAFITDQENENKKQVAHEETAENEITEGGKEEKGQAMVPATSFIDIPICSSSPLPILPTSSPKPLAECLPTPTPPSPQLLVDSISQPPPPPVLDEFLLLQPPLPSSPPPSPPPPPTSPPPPPSPVLDAPQPLLLPPAPPLPQSLIMASTLPPPSLNAQPRKRKPSHGWFNADADAYQDWKFINLPPWFNKPYSPRVTSSAKPLRRTRWDIKPEEI